MAKVLTICNQKGGVGKTTTAVTLAHGLALKGKRVLVIDTDPQGQSSTFLKVPECDGLFDFLTNEKPVKDTIRPARKNLWILPGYKKTAWIMNVWRALANGDPPTDKLARMIAPLRGAVDYIVFDTGPTAGGLQDQAIFAADGIVIPSMPDYASAKGVSEVWNTLQLNQTKGWAGKVIGILPTMYRKTDEADETMKQYREVYGAFVLEKVHDTVVFKECVSEGITIWEKSGKEPTITRAAEEYGALVRRVLEVM
jgi:chromosome partitioning protein